MRIPLAAGLAGLAAVSLAACNKPGAAAGSSAAAGAGPAAAGPLSVDQFPHRKPGLWTQTMAMDGAPTGAGAIQLCVDAASEARMNMAAQNIAGAKCATPRFNRALDGAITFTNSCDMGAGGKIQTTGTIKGDFNSGYVATMASTTTGAPMAAMNGAHTMVVTASWTGPCAPGQTGGDMILPDGMKVNGMAALSAAPPAPSGGQ
ncbi:MAG TPA: DUF3617 family protein [Caulobacteraceae bacterium]|jgi:hypothetical protein